MINNITDFNKNQVANAYVLLAALLKEHKVPVFDIDEEPIILHQREADAGEFGLMNAMSYDDKIVYNFKHVTSRNYLHVEFNVRGASKIMVPRTKKPFFRGGFPGICKHAGCCNPGELWHNEATDEAGQHDECEQCNNDRMEAAVAAHLDYLAEGPF